MENLYVYPDNMMKNINLTNGLIYSQEVLLALIKKGLNREDAYKIVQENAMKVWKEKCDFKDQLFNNKIVSKYLLVQLLRHNRMCQFHRNQNL